MAKPRRKAFNTLVTIAVIAVVTAIVCLAIFNTEPEAEREAATRKSAMLVEVLTLQTGSHIPLIEAHGLIHATNLVDLKAEVAGPVITTALETGKTVAKGELLLEIDSREHRIRKQHAESALNKAQAALDIEMGEQALARNEFSALSKPLSDMQRSLVLREPQLAAAKAELSGAKAQLALAELSLSKTRITAPFDAEILDYFVGPGALVSAGTVIARIVDTSRYQVILSVPRAKYSELALPDRPSSTAPKARCSQANGEGFTALMTNSISQLPTSTRMVKIVLSIPEPDNLFINDFVSCEIPVKQLTGVAKIPRDYLRKGDTLWLMEQGKLKIVDASLRFKGTEHVYVSNVNSGQKLIISELSSIRQGAALKLKQGGASERP